MAKNLVFKYTESKTRVRTLGAPVDSGTPVLDPTDQRPAVALTNSGSRTKTVTNADIPMGGGVTSITYGNGGAGLSGNETTLAYDGTWEFASITGVTTSTNTGQLVYITSGGALTTTATGNTLYGVVDYPLGYAKVAGVAPVRIGA